MWNFGAYFNHRDRRGVFLRVNDKRIPESRSHTCLPPRFPHSPDSQGRGVLTPALLEYAGIGKEAVIVGCADYAEIWAADKYDAEMNTVNPEELRSALEALGL